MIWLCLNKSLNYISQFHSNRLLSDDYVPLNTWDGHIASCAMFFEMFINLHHLSLQLEQKGNNATFLNFSRYF